MLQPQQQAGLQAELEHSMWVAADIRATSSLRAAQQAQRAQQGLDTAQSVQQASDAQHGMTQQAKQAQHGSQSSVAHQPAVVPSQRPNHADSSLTQHEPEGLSQTSPQGKPALPWGAVHPLQLLHDTLGTIAGRIVLQQVHGSLQRLMSAKGKWPNLLKLNAAAVLPNGIR